MSIQQHRFEKVNPTKWLVVSLHVPKQSHKNLNKHREPATTRGKFNNCTDNG
jgi:hypothetical protein